MNFKSLWSLVLCCAVAGCGSIVGQGPLRVRVVDGAGHVIANVMVVVGTASGAIDTYQMTNSAGEAVFYSSPDNAVVTAATSCYSASADRTYHRVYTVYQVNQAELTLRLGTCSENSAQVDVSVTSTLPAVVSSDITLGAITYGGPDATLSVASGLQDDGKVSVFGTGYDNGDNMVGYGYALDQPAAQGTAINFVIDRTDFTQHSHTVLNIPVEAQSYYYFASLLRKHAMTNLPLNFGFGGTPVPASVTSYAAGSYSDDNMLGMALMLDLDNDGTADAQAGIIHNLRTMVDETFDFSAAPAIPAALDYVQGSGGRPQVSWNNPDPLATVNVVTISYRAPAPARNSYSYILTAPETMTTVVFPALPEELAAFRPVGYDTLTLQTIKYTSPYGYAAFLAAFDETRGRIDDATAFRAYSYAQVSRVP